MPWLPRRSGNLFLVFSTIVCILITIVNYNVLKELPTNSKYWSRTNVQDDWKNGDIERRLLRLENHIFGKGYNSSKQNINVPQRLAKLEQHIKKTEEKKCKIPNDWLFPFCETKVTWMQQLWGTNKDCYVGKHNIDPESICSILIYLSEVETFCPIMPWRQRNTTKVKEHKLATIRFELDSTFINTLNKLNLRWMRDRITRMWPQWVAAAKQFAAEGSVRRPHQAKKIFIFFGTYAYQPNWLNLAYHGAPLGEMVQWSDLLAALYILGHDLTLSANATTYKNHLSVPKVASCADVFTPEFDAIYVDYNGLVFMNMNMNMNIV